MRVLVILLFEGFLSFSYFLFIYGSIFVTSFYFIDAFISLEGDVDDFDVWSDFSLLLSYLITYDFIRAGLYLVVSSSYSDKSIFLSFQETLILPLLRPMHSWGLRRWKITDICYLSKRGFSMELIVTVKIIVFFHHGRKGFDEVFNSHIWNSRIPLSACISPNRKYQECDCSRLE